MLLRAKPEETERHGCLDTDQGPYRPFLNKEAGQVHFAGGTPLSIAQIARALKSSALATVVVLGSVSIASGSNKSPCVRAEIARAAFDHATCDYWHGNGASRDLTWIEETVRPRESQRAAFDAFSVAVHQAQETMRAACRVGPTDETKVIPKKIEAMFRVFAIICPAFDALYAQLDNYQKIRLHEGIGWW